MKIEKNLGIMEAQIVFFFLKKESLWIPGVFIIFINEPCYVSLTLFEFIVGDSGNFIVLFICVLGKIMENFGNISIL